MDEREQRNIEHDPTIVGNDVQREVRPDDRDVTARPVREEEATTSDYVGEAAGGISGGIAGVAIGSLAGPVGTLIGGLAGVIGGWWAGRSIAEAAKDYGETDDEYYRAHYERGSRVAARSYDDVRPAYQLGHLASRNPDYRGRPFEEVEADLKRGWSDEVRERHGDWSVARDYAREGYTRGATTLSATSAGAVDASVRTSEKLDDREDLEDRSTHASDRVTEALERGGHRAADAIDSVKDRIDGNPASKPGPDPTDRRFQ